MELLAATAIALIIEFGVVEERRDEFVEISTERIEEIRAFEGNRSFEVLVDEARPGVVVYVETWDDSQKQAAFYDWWVAEGMTERLAPLVTGAPKISRFELVTE